MLHGCTVTGVDCRTDQTSEITKGKKVRSRCHGAAARDLGGNRNLLSPVTGLGDGHLKILAARNLGVERCDSGLTGGELDIRSLGN